VTKISPAVNLRGDGKQMITPGWRARMPCGWPSYDANMVREVEGVIMNANAELEDRDERIAPPKRVY
jgi:hypothetical protein